MRCGYASYRGGMNDDPLDFLTNIMEVFQIETPELTLTIRDVDGRADGAWHRASEPYGLGEIYIV